jgi:hypothetical protein
MVSNPPKFVIDTCSLIKLREDYPPDVFPRVWDMISRLADSGTLISSDEVFEELNVDEAVGDPVLTWAEDHRPSFYPLDGFIQGKATEILATYPGLLDLKRNKSGADPFVIATAINFSCVVVTDELPTKNISGRVKIPDVCSRLSILSINLIEMMRAEGLKF